MLGARFMRARTARPSEPTSEHRENAANSASHRLGVSPYVSRLAVRRDSGEGRRKLQRICFVFRKQHVSCAGRIRYFKFQIGSGYSSRNSAGHRTQTRRAIAAEAAPRPPVYEPGSTFGGRVFFLTSTFEHERRFIPRRTKGIRHLVSMGQAEIGSKTDQRCSHVRTGLQVVNVGRECGRSSRSTGTNSGGLLTPTHSTPGIEAKSVHCVLVNTFRSRN